MKKKDKVYTVLAVVFPITLLLLVLFDDFLVMSLGDKKIILYVLPIIGAVWVFIVSLWRVLYSMATPEKFSAKIIIPAGTVLVCMVLVFISAMPLNKLIKEMAFNQKEQALTEFVRQHEKDSFTASPTEITLTGKDKKLSATGTVQVVLVEDKPCFLFYTLKTDLRIEGYLYLPEDRLFYGVYGLYSDFSDTAYNENFSWVSFYTE